MEASQPTPYELLKTQRYISLVTFKKNGARVATPLWSAADNESFYAYTGADSWKIKRLRNNSSVAERLRIRTEKPDDYIKMTFATIPADAPPVR